MVIKASAASAHRPYPGQRPYGAAESARFAGRDGAAHSVAALWCSHQVTVLSGRSGVGKTSLLHAGILPLLDMTSHDVLPVGKVADRSLFPAAALFDHNRFVFALLSSWAAAESPIRLSRMSISDFLRQRRGRAGAARTLIAIDQAEEFLRAPHRDERDWFVDQLAEALRDHPDVHVLIVVREDRLGDILADERLSIGAKVALPALSRKAAIEAIRRPAAAGGRAFSAGAAEALVDLLREFRVVDEPLDHPIAGGEMVQPAILQVACSALWDALPPDATIITVSHVSALVDIDECLATFVGSCIMAIAQYHDARPAQLHAWLTRMFITETGSRAAPEPAAAPAGSRGRILRRLEDFHVLRSELRAGTRWFSLLSDHLIIPLRRAVLPAPHALAELFAGSLADRLTEAAGALSDGEPDFAEQLGGYVLSASSGSNFRLRAQAETLLGNIAFHRGEAEQTRRHYLTAAELFEAVRDRLEVGLLLAAIGRLHLLNWDASAAVAALHSAAGRLPADGAVMLDLAQAFASSGEARAAVAMLGDVLTTDAEVGAEDARLLRAEILADLGDAAGALRELEDMPRSQLLSARAARAFSLARLGRLEDADEGIGQVLEDGRDNGPVLLRAAQIRALRGDAAGAERYLRKAIDATAPKLSQYQRRQADSLRLERSV